MKCPICEEGIIINVKDKFTLDDKMMCDFCDSLWFSDETISPDTAHIITSNPHDVTYAIDELNKKDQDHQPVREDHQLEKMRGRIY